MSAPRQHLAVAEAARELGISPGRVRELVHSGQLDAWRPGRELLIDAESVRRRVEVVRPGAGRPLSPRLAWGMIWQLSGVRAPWLAPAERSRVTKYIRRLPVERWPRMLANRADVYRARMLPGPLERLRKDPDAAVGGVAAAAHYGIDLVGHPDDVEIYVDAERFGELVAAKRVNVSPQVPNVVIRVPRIPSVLRFDASDASHAGFAPPAAVAADLADIGDERSVLAARRLCAAFGGV